MSYKESEYFSIDNNSKEFYANSKVKGKYNIFKMNLDYRIHE